MLENRRLDKSVPMPLYYQLKTLIAEEIENGSYPVGSLIPTEAELSEMFAISRTTVRQAIAELVHEGKLYRVKSKGTFVARQKIRQDFMNRLQSFNEEMRQSGRCPSTEVLSLNVVTTPEELEEMGCRWPKQSILLHRRRCADGEAVVCVQTYLPYDKCRHVLSHDFTNESMYTVLAEDESTRVTRVCRICEAVAADKQDTELLGVKKGSPIHFITTLGYNQAGDVVEYSLARYRGDQNKFYVELKL